MKIIRCASKEELGQRSASDGAELMRRAIREKGGANIIVATGASQLGTIENLTRAPDLDWSKVTAFHLDEYINMPPTHSASFQRYLKEFFIAKLPRALAAFHFVDGMARDPHAECRRYAKILANHPIDVAFIGIGENGHLAFNDPPADFETREAMHLVKLDEACRRQQFNEGWFGKDAKFENVPTIAISMSVPQIMKSERIVCSVPDQRKAVAVKNAMNGPVTPQVPASILQRHEGANVYLDPDSASLL
jgi:glucosamine-6-phosphate deaminase